MQLLAYAVAEGDTGHSRSGHNLRADYAFVVESFARVAYSNQERT